MSTKTLRKRIALVAVAALGFGLISTVPSNATAVANGDDPTQIKLNSFTNTTTTFAARVNNEVSIAVTATGSAASPGANKLLGMTIAASITEQPTSSAKYVTLTAADPTGSFDYAAAGLSWDDNQALAGINDTQTATRPAQLNYNTLSDVAWAGGDSVPVGTVTFTPSHVGTYKIIVWNETATVNADIAAAGTAEDGAAASFGGVDPYITFTVIVSAGVSTIALTPVNATSVEEGAYGSLVKVTITDAAGNAAALASGESISIDPSGSGLVAYTAAGVTGSPAATSGATAGGAYSLSASDFVGGVAYVNITDADAETVSLVASLSSNSSVQASTALTFAAKAATAATVAPSALTTGWVSTGSAAFSVPQIASVTFKISAGSGQTTVRYPVTVTDVSGKVTGKTGGVYDVAVAPLGTFTVAATFTALTSQNFTVGGSIDTAGANTAAHTFTVAAVNPGSSVVNANVTGGDTVAFTNSALRIAPAGTASHTITVSDQWGNVLPNATVTLTWSGRNTSTAATQKTGLTNADGQITLAYTDTAASTVTATADTVTATAVYGANSSTSTATVNWLATTVGTVTLTSTGDTDTVAGTTKTDISAAVAGATGTAATASALVKDANGVIIVGTPVTFTVTGLVGAEVHTTNATVYTDSTGTAVANISSYAAGKATVTATAGTISATDDLYFSQQTVTEARTISATVSGNNVVATVKDRYGNTIEGVTVNATRVGTGFFGTGASTATGSTDKNGVIEFQYNGEGTVTVAFSTTTYGQSTSAADKVGTTAVTAAVAGTATVNQVGLGAAFAPAGVNSVAVTVAAQENAAQTAADAAAEATDAANAATDAANAAAEAADAATAAAQDAADAVAALSASVTEMVNALKKQVTSLTALVIKIQKKLKA